MDYRLRIARRYLVSRKRFSLISVISGISIAGVTIGTAMLIIVLSVLNGFFDLVRDLLVSFDPHIRVVAVDSRGFEPQKSLYQTLSQTKYVQHVLPYAEGKAQLLYDVGNHETKIVIVRGLDKQHLTTGLPLKEKTNVGQFNVDAVNGFGGMVIGEALGNYLGVFPQNNTPDAKTVQLRSAAAIEQSVQNFGLMSFPQYKVRGLFRIDPRYDESHVFIDLKEAQKLFLLGNRISGIELRLDNLDHAEKVKQDLENRLDKQKYKVQTWYDLQKSLYDTMRLEKWGATLILTLIILVAAFNIIGSLTMIVIEKRRDLGILQAMGASKKDIRTIFLMEGALIGGFGVAFGLLIGLGAVFLQDRFKLVKLSNAESFLIQAYPVALQWNDVLMIAVGVLLLCMLSTLYPAYRAAQTEPAKAVKHE
jgi:lipoprotein-releasing system permease protein